MNYSRGLLLLTALAAVSIKTNAQEAQSLMVPGDEEEIFTNVFPERDAEQINRK